MSRYKPFSGKLEGEDFQQLYNDAMGYAGELLNTLNNQPHDLTWDEQRDLIANALIKASTDITRTFEIGSGADICHLSNAQIRLRSHVNAIQVELLGMADAASAESGAPREGKGRLVHAGGWPRAR